METSFAFTINDAPVGVALGAATGASFAIDSLSGRTSDHDCAERSRSISAPYLVRPLVHVFADEMLLIRLHVFVGIGDQFSTIHHVCYAADVFLRLLEHELLYLA